MATIRHVGPLSDGVLVPHRATVRHAGEVSSGRIVNSAHIFTARCRSASSCSRKNLDRISDVEIVCCRHLLRHKALKVHVGEHLEVLGAIHGRSEVRSELPGKNGQGLAAHQSTALQNFMGLASHLHVFRGCLHGVDRAHGVRDKELASVAAALADNRARHHHGEEHNLLVPRTSTHSPVSKSIRWALFPIAVEYHMAMVRFRYSALWLMRGRSVPPAA